MHTVCLQMLTSGRAVAAGMVAAAEKAGLDAEWVLTQLRNVADNPAASDADRIAAMKATLWHVGGPENLVCTRPPDLVYCPPPLSAVGEDCFAPGQIPRREPGELE